MAHAARAPRTLIRPPSCMLRPCDALSWLKILHVIIQRARLRERPRESRITAMQRGAVE